MAVKKKIVAQLKESIDIIAADATDAQFVAAKSFIDSLITDSDESEEDEEEKVVKKKGKKSAVVAEDEEEDDEEEEDEEDDEEEEDEEESEEEDDEEEEDEEDEEEEDEDEDDEEEDDEDEEEEDEEEDEEDEEEEKPVKKKATAKKAVAEEEGRNYKALNEKKIVTILKDSGVDPSVYSKIKTNKVKLVKLLKTYDEAVAEYKAKSLTKLEAMAKKQKVEVKFGRGRSSPERKTASYANALAAASLS